MVKEVMELLAYREVIKRKRLALGISQNKLAKEVGITQTFLSEIESGRKAPSVEVLFKLCQALDIQVFPNE